MKSYGLSIMPEAGDGKIPVSDANGLVVWTTATGSGAPVRATSPTLVTPTLGAASASSLSITDGGAIASGDVSVVFDHTNHYLEITGGKVGIGTTSPGTTAEIYRYETVNRQTYTDILTISAAANTNPYTGHGGGILFKATNYDSGTSLVNCARIGSTITNASFFHTGANLFFDVTPLDEGTLSTAMTIKYDGNVGIGTTSPLTPLEVQGGLTTTGAVLTLSSKETSTVANDILGCINFRAALDAAGTDAILTAASIAAIAENTFSSTVNETGIQFSTGASEVAVERMRIDHHGKVGIGTTSPGYKLAVVGGNFPQVFISNSETNSSTKHCMIGGGHYTSSEEPIGMVYGYSDSTANQLFIGGGASQMNTATSIFFITAANNTTVSGTQRVLINETGIDVAGAGHFQGAVTATSYVTGSPAYEGDAVSELIKIKSDKGKLDHASLPVFAQATFRKYKKPFDERFPESGSEEVTEPGQDLGAMISMLTVAIQQIDTRLKAIGG
jgi:hypothetical protein